MKKMIFFIKVIYCGINNCKKEKQSIELSKQSTKNASSIVQPRDN